VALFRISCDEKELRRIPVYNVLFNSILFHCADVQEQQVHSICQLQEDVNRHEEAITQLTQQ